MTATAEISVWIPVLAALSGALIGSVAPVVVGLINARAAARVERLRLAVQLAVEDHKHMTTVAQDNAKRSPVKIGIPPISAVLAYHLKVMDALQESGCLTPEDFVELRARAKASYDALAGTAPTGETEA